jgi:hypothetical protein
MVRAADMTHLPPGIRFPEGREPTQVEIPNTRFSVLFGLFLAIPV